MPDARYTAVDSSSFQPSRIGFGSIFGAPLPAGRISKYTCGARFASVFPTLASTVPATTLEPAFSGRSLAFFVFSPTVPAKKLS